MVFELTQQVKENITKHRRYIHQNPELGFKEYKTHQYVCKVLAELKIKHETLANTGIVAIIGDAKKYQNKCIAFRAELDALPILEATDLEYSSVNKGIMHACGHDMHIAMLLGVAEIFQKAKELPFCIKLIFQPGEEILPGGAKRMIEENCLKNPVPKMIFAGHIEPSLMVGTFETAVSATMAATCEFVITIKGKSVHGSTPHLGSDPLLVAANIINFAQSFIVRYNNPLFPAVLSICANNGGSVNNAFPNECKMLGTLRTFDANQRNTLLKLFEDKVKLLCEVYDVACDIDIVLGYPAVINDKNAFEIVENSVKNLPLQCSFKVCKPKMWAEDFAYYAKEIPACFYFIGAATESIEMKPLHSNKFNPSEEAMYYGAALILEIAKCFKNL